MRQFFLTVSSSVSRFFQWWTAQLSACGQDVLAGIAPKWRRTLTLYVDRQRLLIVAGDSVTAEQNIEVPRSSEDSATPFILPDSQRHALERGRRVRLVFDGEFAFIKKLRMPFAALPHLKSAMNLQLSKWLPMNAALLTTDFAIVAVDPEHSAIDVELAAIKHADIEPVANAIRSWGMRLNSIHLGGATDRSPRFRFATSDAQSRGFAIARIDSVLVVTAAALGITAVAVSAVQAYRAHKALDQAQMLTHTEAAIVLEQRQQLTARMAPLVVLSSAQRSPSAATILTDITTHVPRDTWLTTFELKGRSLRLVGLSPDAATVVKLLATSALLADVELRSSMAAGMGSGKDRFEITAELKGGA